MKKLLLTFLLLLLPLQVFAQPISIVKETGKEIYKVKNLGDEGKDEIIIGDELNPSTFKPQFKVTKWNKENSLTIRCDDIDGITTVDGNKITTKNKGNDKEFYINPIDDITLKFGVNFLKKPTSNKIVFQLEGWEEFDFFYQPPLANINPDGSTWEGEKGKGTYGYRPANVNGSYAIYHKTKVNYAIGKTNYKTGKFGHYYRPKFIDADGILVWVDLNIKDGVITITIPQDFLDKAKYPIRANDEWGYHTIGGSAGSFDASGDAIVALTGSTPTYSGKLNYILWYLNPPSTVNFIYGLYDDVGGVPTNRIAVDASNFSVSSGAGWKSNSVDYNTTITATTTYWFGSSLQTATVTPYYYDSGQLRYYNIGTGLTNPWLLEGGSAVRLCSVYATYTPATGSLLNNCVINNAVIQ